MIRFARSLLLTNPPLILEYSMNIQQERMWEGEKRSPRDSLSRGHTWSTKQTQLPLSIRDIQERHVVLAMAKYLLFVSFRGIANPSVQ